MAQIVAGIHCKLYHYLYTKWAEIFPVSRQLNVQISQHPLNHFLPNKGHSTCNWTTNHVITLSWSFLMILELARNRYLYDAKRLLVILNQGAIDHQCACAI